MIRGVLRIVGFFCLVGGLAWGMDFVINRGLKRISTSKQGAFNDLMAGRVNAAIVISGSSRALNHYNPSVIGEITTRSAYNMGMNASKIDLQLAILKTYLKHNRPPELVLQNLDLFSLETTGKGEIYEPASYLPYLHEEELYGFLRKVDPNVWKWKYLPLYGYAVEDMRFSWVAGLLGNVGVYGTQDYVQGYHPQFKRWTGDFERFQAANSEGVSYRIDPGGIQALEEIIQLCHSRGIAIVLVFSPEYSEMQALQRNRDEILTKLQNISDRTQVPCWDYSRHELSRNRENFYNSQHLNAEGAIHFSKDLGRKIIDSTILK